MIPFNLLRLKKNPQNLILPPKGQVDLRFDPDQDAFVRVDPDGTRTPLGSASAFASFRTVTESTRTILESDNGKVLVVPDDIGGTREIDLPDGLPEGFNCAVFRYGDEALSVVGVGDIVSVSGNSAILDPYGVCSVLVLPDGTALISGNV